MTRVRWKLYADRDIEKNTVDELRKADFNVFWAIEHPELPKSDDFHCNNSRKMGRFLVTRDQDFWDNKKHPLRASPFLVILGNKDPKNDASLLIKLRSIIYDLLSPQGGVRPTQLKFKLSDMNINYQYIDIDTGLEVSENTTWGNFMR
jgi:predicted nuclease of predicted toxin-antitoxin system